MVTAPSFARRVGLGLSLVLGACAGGPTEVALPFPPAGPEARPAPVLPGPFRVGVTTLVIDDTTRRDANGQPRRLVTEVWYPARPASGADAGVAYALAEFLTPEQVERAGPVPPLETAAVRGAAADLRAGPYPMVLFSHGQGGMRWQSTSFTVHLASHGYIVAAVDHPGSDFSALARGTLQGINVGIDDRPLDLRFVRRRLGRFEAGEPLFGMVDVARVGVAGHSFGALTALRLAATDEGLGAVVAFAPTTLDVTWLGLPRPITLTMPVMMQVGLADKTLPWPEHGALAWAGLARPRWLLQLQRGGHYTFSDFCRFDLEALQQVVQVPGVDVSEVLGDGCGPEATPSSKAQALINHFAVGLFNAALRGSTSSYELLGQTGADALAPGEATVQAEP